MNRPMACFVLFVVLLAGTQVRVPVRAQAPAQPAEEIAARLEQRLQTLRSLQADFDQFFHSSSQTAPLHEKGRFFLQKPNRMRWEYFEPEAKVFLCQEGIFEQYYAEDNQLIRSRLTGEESGAEILALLAGENKLRASYAIEPGPDPAVSKKARSLKLTPLGEGEYTSILVEVDDLTSLPVRLVFSDLAGNRTEFLFRKAKVDLSLPAGTFRLKVPQDCEIIDELPPSPRKDI
jgi:outer membrane lipoprotein-sorting protein